MTSLLVVIPDTIDVEEESRFYDELCDTEPDKDPGLQEPDGPCITRLDPVSRKVLRRSFRMTYGSVIIRVRTSAFARDVQISGWTNVGDKLGGAARRYMHINDTAPFSNSTKHSGKAYLYDPISSFFSSDSHTFANRPQPHQQHFVPALPPKSPLSRYRPAFLDHRRRQLQYWLSAVLLHPEIGACQAVRWWVMD
ncbi:hypothetical protein J3R83DRAFT_7970 [Lanmaoa asiatica]|nr:hypothetical protein J3R83DRAFT_7970 [Lanmaoa asiatica]